MDSGIELVALLLPLRRPICPPQSAPAARRPSALPPEAVSASPAEAVSALPPEATLSAEAVSGIVHSSLSTGGTSVTSLLAPTPSSPVTKPVIIAAIPLVSETKETDSVKESGFTSIANDASSSAAARTSTSCARLSREAGRPTVEPSSAGVLPSEERQSSQAAAMLGP